MADKKLYITAGSSRTDYVTYFKKLGIQGDKTSGMEVSSSFP